MSIVVMCPVCAGECGRTGRGQWACPRCDSPGANGVCARCDGVKPEALLTTWHAEGYAETVCLPCVRAASISVLDCAG